jgi:hypothetical protein
MQDSDAVDPWKLAFAHRGREAVAAMNRFVRREPGDYLHHANRGILYLFLDRLDEAFADFAQARELHLRSVPEGEGAYSRDLATVEWLRGNKAEAIREVRSAVDGILDGTITYADFAGGVGPGLLLWFMGLRADDAEAAQYALKYLKKLSKRRKIKSWPGPLALYALGKLSFEDVLYEVGGPHDEAMYTNVDGVLCRMDTLGGSRDLATVRRWAETDLLRRRQLCRALFYRGVKSLSEGDAKGYAWWMGECCALENPILEMEWYIARHEARQVEKIRAKE